MERAGGSPKLQPMEVAAASALAKSPDKGGAAVPRSAEGDGDGRAGDAPARSLLADVGSTVAWPSLVASIISLAVTIAAQRACPPHKRCHARALRACAAAALTLQGVRASLCARAPNKCARSHRLRSAIAPVAAHAREPGARGKLHARPAASAQWRTRIAA
jgi:hypothetical protein